MTKKQEREQLKKLITKADKVFSEFIRNRDKAKGCVTCGGPVQHNCHWIPRGWYSHRWDEDNCYGGCVGCNMYHQEEHKILFTVMLTKKHGLAWIDKQLLERSKDKPSIEEVEKIIEKYGKKK